MCESNGPRLDRLIVESWEDPSDDMYDDVSETYALNTFDKYYKAQYGKTKDKYAYKRDREQFRKRFHDTRALQQSSDSRYTQVKQRHERTRVIRELAKYQLRARRFGLDAEFIKVMQNVLGPERYNEIVFYTNPDKVAKTAATQSPQDRDAFLRKAEKAGTFTEREMYELKKAFEDILSPKIEDHNDAIASMKADPVKAMISNTKTDSDISVSYTDITKKDPATGKLGVKRLHILRASESLTARLNQLSMILTKVDPGLSQTANRMYRMAYTQILKKLNSVSPYKSDEYAAQRNYTAALFALYIVAPKMTL
jgi:hypothetical protein